MKTNNILVFNPFGIGDVVFSMPLIENLKESLNARITYICNRRVYPLLKDNPLLDKVLVFEKDEWKAIARKSKFQFFKKLFSFRRDIKKSKFDIIFDLSLNAQYGLFFKIAGVRTRIGFNFKKRGRFLTHKIDIPQGYKDKHVARYYLSLLWFLDIDPKEYCFDLFIPRKKIKAAEGILRKHRISKDAFLVGVSPGSGDSWGNTAYFRRWPRTNFTALCSLLQKKIGAKIIVFGSKSEISLCSYLYDNLEEKPIDLCGKINLEEFCGLVSFCDLILTNDGGPFHIAQALHRKIVVFFGPQNEKIYGVYPEGSNCLVIKKDLCCQPCYEGFRFKGCKYDKKCLREISPEEVFPMVEKLITR